MQETLHGIARVLGNALDKTMVCLASTGLNGEPIVTYHQCDWYHESETGEYLVICQRCSKFLTIPNWLTPIGVPSGIVCA